MKTTLFFMLLLITWGCENSTPVNTHSGCEDHKKGYDVICGCPEKEVGFAGWCINTDLVDRVYYFGNVQFKCITDSIALGVNIANGTIEPVINFTNPIKSLEFTNTLHYKTQSVIAKGFGCENIPEYNSGETTYFFVQNPNELDNLPEKLGLKLEHKEGPGLQFKTLASSEVTLYKDADRK